MRKKALLRVLAGAVLVAGCAEPKNVDIVVRAPTAVQQGERFTFRAVARNTARRSQKLVSLDIADEYLDGIVIESAEPAFSDAMHIPIDNTMSYSFDLRIPPGEEVEVVFHAYAAHPGDHAGEVDFCINSELSFLSYPLRTIVQ